MALDLIDAETQLKNLNSAINSYVSGLITTSLSSYMKVQDSNFNASTEPNYPSANRGESLYITTGGKIGGSSGKVVEAGDVAIAIQTNAGGNEALVGTAWFIIQKNIEFDNVADHWLNGQGSFTTPTAAQLNAIPSDGWIGIATTWTRTGNHTFTVPGDLTAYYRKGTKVRYKDGGSFEYGVIGSSSFAGSTTVNLIPNTDYAMAATTITDTYLSYIENPQGFPAVFNWSPAPTNLTLGTGGTTTAKYRAIGDLIFYEIAWVLGTSPSVGDISFTPPVATASPGSRQNQGVATLLDAGVQNYFGVVLTTGASTFNMRANTVAGSNVVNSTLSSSSPFSWGASDAIFVSGWYSY